jgi:hypothetical protein
MEVKALLIITSIALRSSRLRRTERTLAIKDSELLRAAVKGPRLKHLLRSDEDAQRLGEQGDGGMSWISISVEREGFGDIRGGRGRGEGEMLIS